MNFRTSESSDKYNPVNDKVDISLKNRFARGNGTPISARYKKSGNEEISMHMQQDHHRRERLQQTYREAPSIEIGPKRLKVRGPSFLGIESRLNWSVSSCLLKIFGESDFANFILANGLSNNTENPNDWFRKQPQGINQLGYEFTFFVQASPNIWAVCTGGDPWVLWPGCFSYFAGWTWPTCKTRKFRNWISGSLFQCKFVYIRPLFRSC